MFYIYTYTRKSYFKKGLRNRTIPKVGLKLHLQTKCNRIIHIGWAEIDFTNKRNQSYTKVGTEFTFQTKCYRTIHEGWDEIDFTNKM